MSKDDGSTDKSARSASTVLTEGRLIGGSTINDSAIHSDVSGSSGESPWSGYRDREIIHPPPPSRQPESWAGKQYRVHMAKRAAKEAAVMPADMRRMHDMNGDFKKHKSALGGDREWKKRVRGYQDRLAKQRGGSYDVHLEWRKWQKKNGYSLYKPQKHHHRHHYEARSQSWWRETQKALQSLTEKEMGELTKSFQSLGILRPTNQEEGAPPIEEVSIRHNEAMGVARSNDGECEDAIERQQRLRERAVQQYQEEEGGFAARIEAERANSGMGGRS